MSMELLFELGWKSALCAGLTLLLLALMARRSAAERSLLAHVGLFATLLLPLSVLVLPDWQVAAPQRAPSAIWVAETMPAPAISSEPGTAAVLSEAAHASTVETSTIAIGDVLPWAYGVPALLLVLLLMLAVMRLHLLRARSDVLVQPHWTTALAAAQRRLGFKHGTALLVSAELRSPISWGLVRPVILLDPRSAADGRQAEAIIAHELSHVARLDWAKLLMGRLASAIFWFNPLVWLLARRCHQLCEESVDDAVLRHDIRNTDYAELLISAARHDSRAILLAANGVTGSGPLTQRVERVLDQSLSRSPARLGWTLACCAGALLVSTPIAALAVVDEASSRALAAASRSVALDPQSGLAPARSELLSAARSPAEAGQAAPGVAPPSFVSVAGAGTAAAADAAQPSPRQRQSLIASGVIAEAFIEAARKGDFPTMRHMLALGVSPNSGQRGDGTPLIAAVEAGRTDVAKFLLGNGAQADVAVLGDGTALIAAARSGRRDLVELLLARGARIDKGIVGDGNPLIAAAAAGRIDIVRLLLERGADPERIVPGDENALISASRKGHEDVVRLLIDRGADVNRLVFGRTALRMARVGGNRRIEQLLIEAGARQ